MFCLELLIAAVLLSPEERLQDCGIRSVLRPHAASEYVYQHLTVAAEEMERLCAYPRVARFMRVHPIESYRILDTYGIPWMPNTGYIGYYEAIGNLEEVTIAVYMLPEASQRMVMRHEIGHHLYHAGRGLVSRSEWEDYYYRNDRRWWADQVGNYASKNASEAFAEAIAIFTHPKYKSGRLDPYIEEWLDHALGMP